MKKPLDLHLDQKLSDQEIKELENRWSSSMMQAFYQGLNFGKSLGESDFNYELEQKTKENLKHLVSHLIQDAIWGKSPPSTYRGTGEEMSKHIEDVVAENQSD